MLIVFLTLFLTTKIRGHAPSLVVVLARAIEIGDARIIHFTKLMLLHLDKARLVKAYDLDLHLSSAEDFVHLE